MRFKDLELRRHYNSDEDDVLACFYRPVVASALRYDRAVGYFSSTTFRACGAELASFLGRQGQIRLVIGCLVDPADIRELEGKGLSGSDAEREALRREIKEQLERSIEGDVDSSVLFAQLVVSGAAQVKFAVRKRGIYHEKFGVFADADGERIAFIGSVNETSAALTFGANHESFSVYRSSESHIYDAYGTDLESRFERLWTGDTVATTIYELGDDSLSLMRQLASRASADHATPTAALPKLEPRFQLRPYQHEAIKAWAENRYRGIFAMATGTGKTLTAIDAVKRFRAKVSGGAVVITVPYQNLALQWMEALRDQGLEVIGVFESYGRWYPQVENLFLASRITDTVEMPCLVCVNDTFKDVRLQELFELLGTAKQRNHLLIVDECHHFNSPEHLAKLPPCFTLRLGLSATPYDQYSKAYLDEYFDRIVYEFSLGRAIEDGYLTPYRYHVLTCALDADETDSYEEITRKIVQIAGSDDGFTPETLAKAQPLLLQRSRLVGAAHDKLVKLETHLRATGRSSHTLFYCGDGSLDNQEGARLRQIERVSELLHSLGWRSSRITAEETLAERELLLEGLRRQSIDAVVSIRVLDEGIDIPACRVAYLLASQSSTRQGIQRRGRVLRKSEGKTSAELYDFLVLGGATKSKAMLNLAAKELKRAWRFASDASNKGAMQKVLQPLFDEVGANTPEETGSNG